MTSGKKSGAHADLGGARLSGAFLVHANLSEANLSGADLGGARLSGADLTRALIDRANLSGAYLYEADLPGANLSYADLREANLSRADLHDAYLRNADLSKANLSEADLSGAELFLANLGRALFEPKSLPPVESIALAAGLELTTYYENPGPLTQLRKQFQDAGYREQERAITCALWRRSVRLRPFIVRWFSWVAFDLTCEYGFAPGRPLGIEVLLCLLSSIIYTVFIHRPGYSGIHFIGTRWSRGIANPYQIRIRPRALPTAKWWKLPVLWILRELRVLRAAMFFSLMSAFNFTFRDINFGRWLRLLTKREYDLKAIGWVRTVSGLQTLLSIYLIGLWIKLGYFGVPFG